MVKQLDNQQILQAILNEMPKESMEKLKGLDGENLISAFNDYPTAKNDFINTLTNKVTKSLIYSKIYENPLKMLKQGLLEYGDSIEEIFVEKAQMKGFTGHWEDGADTPEADLIRKLVPKVQALYISVNSDKKFKTTVTDKSLKKAFMNKNGLSRLIQQIVGSITTSVEYDEFNSTKKLLINLVQDAKGLKEIAKNGDDVLYDINNSVTTPIKQTPYAVKIENGPDKKANLQHLSQAIRETIGNMGFISDKYNLTKVETFAKPDELMIVTTPEIASSLDVYVLANAFNVSHTDLKSRMILVDELPKGIFKNTSSTTKTKEPQEVTETLIVDNSVKPIAVLMDKELLQIWDKYQGAGTFYNADGQYTNHFANREMIYATCLFSNLALFYTE